MRKVVVLAVLGLLASLAYVPAAQADPTATIKGGAVVNCNHWPPNIDWTLEVGPNFLIGDNARVVLDGVRVTEVDLVATDHAQGTFVGIDPNVSHTLTFTWFDSINQVLATDTITITTPPSCPVPRPTATLSCAGIVLGNADGSAEAEFTVVINGLALDHTLAAHQASLVINTVHDGDFIQVFTEDWHGDDITLINSHLSCTGPTGTGNGPAATIAVGTCTNRNTVVTLNNTGVATPNTFDVNGQQTVVAAGQTATVALGAFIGTVTVKLGATQLATATVSYANCQNSPVTVKVKRFRPRLNPPLEEQLTLAPTDIVTGRLIRSCGSMEVDVVVNGTVQKSFTVPTFYTNGRRSLVRERLIYSPGNSVLLGSKLGSKCSG